MNPAAGAACALWLAAAAGAQTPPRPQPPLQLELQLAADPEQRGPRAWTWLRGALLAKLPGWRRGRDPFAATGIAIDDGGPRCIAARAPAAPGVYLRADLVLPGVGALRGQATFDGLECWEGEGLRAPRGRPADLVALLGLAPGRGPIVIDVRALIARWLPALDENDPWRALLAVAPAECGELTLLADVDRGRLRVRGRSDGGLLLPALLCVLADLRARPPGPSPLAPITATDRWVVLASCARDGEREEAARQLALSGDPRAADVLERLLVTHDFTRAVAIEALLRRGAAGSLRAIVDAATPAIEGTEELAAAALQSWLPHTAPAERGRLLAALAHHPSARIQDLAAHAGARPASRPWLPVLVLTATLLAGALLARRRTAG